MAGKDIRIHRCDGASAGAGGRVLSLGCDRQCSLLRDAGPGVVGSCRECFVDYHDGICESYVPA